MSSVCPIFSNFFVKSCKIQNSPSSTHPLSDLAVKVIGSPLCKDWEHFVELLEPVLEYLAVFQVGRLMVGRWRQTHTHLA